MTSVGRAGCVPAGASSASRMVNTARRVGEQPHAQRARANRPSSGDQLEARLAGPLGPLAPGRVGDRQQRLPYVCWSVGDALGHGWPRASQLLGDGGGPRSEPVAQRVPLSLVEAWTEGFDVLARRAPSHSNHHGPRHDRVGEIAEPGQRQRSVSGKGLHLLVGAFAYAAVGHGAAAVASVEQPAYLLVFLGLRPKHGVDLVKQDGGPRREVFH